MKMKNELTSHEWQLLSAYLDHQISEKEKKQAEKLLQTRPECQSMLEELSRMQSLLRSLPQHKVPRNFMLSGQKLAQTRVPGIQLLLRYSSVLTALLLTVALALDFLPALQPLTGRQRSEEMVAADMPEMKTSEFAIEGMDEPPKIIYWGGAPAMGAYGKGGGAEGMGGAPMPGYGVGGGSDGVIEIPTDLGAVEEPMLTELIPEEELQEETEDVPPATELETLPVSPEVLPEAPTEKMPEMGVETTIDALALTESSPILGVRPANEQGRIEGLEGLQRPSRQPAFVPNLRILQIILAIALSLLAIPAWVIKRK